MGTDSSFDITATIRTQRLKYLGNILCLSDDESLKIVVTKLTKTEDGECPAGSMFMDTPEHADVQQLCDLANDTAGWAKHVNNTFPTEKHNVTEPPTQDRTARSGDESSPYKECANTNSLASCTRNLSNNKERLTITRSTVLARGL